ncbi:RNA polymerase subunit sigma [Halarcobacter ebronensis]|uniref:RNA polymerase subunit sigma n=1 Tax=Halarcobacter ebronensis TaxID=1462615 RepID=A0A4Q0YEN5_9BACT|nr:RNA polymerase sigma factor [Halarcobacter ebronensis]RXJ68922.1 RNA polymerase subunit sigma [Halarcobacter ebronensis]
MLHYYKEIERFVHKIIGNKEYVTDIVQETYLKALETNSKTSINNKRAFLYKIAKNLVIDTVRKEKNIKKIVFEEEKYVTPNEEFPEEQILELVKQNMIKEAIETLPSRSKQAFVLHFIKGLDTQQISKSMGISVNATQKHISRATLKIKEYITFQGWDLNE